MAPNDPLQRGRAAFGREAWADACTHLTAADRQQPLEPGDLDRLATAAYLVGDDRASADARARAHAAHLERGDMAAAARSAFWLAFVAIDKPDQQAAASGWLARVRRLLDQCPAGCAERGFWLCAAGFQKLTGGDIAGARAAFEEAARIGAACRDADLTALARQSEGRILLRLGQAAEGLATLDEVMVSVTCGEVGPMIAGLVYCSVIGACHEAFDLRRAREWTAALAGWCESHPDMVPFRGTCLVRRSELLQVHGAWPASIDEARRACDSFAAAAGQPGAGAAHYQLAELHRLRGAFDEAEAGYHRASRSGRSPDPGLALLRLAQGDTAAATAGIRRALDETRGPRTRADVLRAFVTILLAAGDAAPARAAAADLGRMADEVGAPFLRAAANAASGAVALADDEVETAISHLRSAARYWQDADAPYELARTRALVGAAYQRRGDEEGARMEFEAAHEVFERLGAAPDAARMAACLARWSTRATGSLTGREVEVLRLVATGRSNRAIAEELSISEKTVARHISNIFTKLDLSSRSAATAYAYEHKLL